jgi:5'-3' exonuclease
MPKAKKMETNTESNKVKNQDETQPLIIVDTSYTSFYRFFATLRWYGFAYPEEFKELKSEPKYDWKTNKIFIEKYEKMYLDSIIKLVKKKVWDKSQVLFCMDSPKVDLWRTQLYCDYKSGRVDLSLKHDFKQTFDYTYNIMIPNFIKTYPNIKSLRVEKMEADDLIAIISMELKDKNPDRPIYLVSGDEDFLQLGRPNLTFVNYKIKKPFVLTEKEAAKALRDKFINGDVSDCIPSIFPKGKKIKKKEILESDAKLNEYLESNPDAKKQYEFNKKMIDFRNIPKSYYNKVTKIFAQLQNLNKLSVNSNNQDNEIEV